ncbi:MAG TPA: glycerophosphodiester phosphodiesterase family protein [Blastocatellia bacterium]|nr:glycerophosphodiester phosphodiesterase family protein [Blastocatellia bacterium]
MPPLIIAHRGASAAEPENTLRAFELAVKHGAQMIELDLHITRDNQVVVIHDPTLNHTTNLKGRIDQLTLAEVKQADAGKGERIPTLEETLDLMRGRARLYLEVKDPRATVETLRIVRERRSQPDVLLASFDLKLMRNLGEEVGDIELGVILGTPSLDPIVRWREAFPWIALRDLNFRVLSMQVDLCLGYLVRRVKASGKHVYAWTVDEEKDYARMVKLGIDGIVTNTPDRLVSYLARNRAG